MTFLDFRTKYYSPGQQAEINSILYDFCIYKDIESSLNDYFKAVESKNKIEIVSQFTLTCRELVTTINRPMRDINPSEANSQRKQKIAEFVNYLISETYLLSGLKPFEYFDLLKRIVRKTYQKHSWDFSVLEKRLNYDKIKEITVKTKEKRNRRTIKLSAPIKFNWHGEKQLDLFVDDLVKTFNGIKGKRQVYRLFDVKQRDFKIELPSKHLLPFLTLFHTLHNSKTINVIGNRGLFVYLHQHLKAPIYDMYPKRDFRKLRYEAENNIKIKKEITSVIKPLLDKYCNKCH